MSQAVEPTHRPTYADIEALPPHVNGEILGGELFVSPRPASRHALAASRLMGWVQNPFSVGLGGPGGWHILHEPELSLAVDPDFDPVIPDLGGWRVETMPELPDVARVRQVPQWVCEVLSPSTHRADRIFKVPFYARAGVAHGWLIDPVGESLEVYALRGGYWSVLSTHHGDETVRAEPFDALPLHLGVLWGRTPPKVG
ncbi:MAG: Uma2 family endonuclease [Myxococcota bacterium]